MITAILFDSGESCERLFSLSVDGHASTDICNAVSMLTQTAGACLSELAVRLPSSIGVETSFTPGRSQIEANLEARASVRLHTTISALHMFLEIGLLQLQSQFPNEIRYFTDVKEVEKTHFLAPV